MGGQAVERKLTTILSADVAGYSRLMGEDEEATLGTLNAYRQVIDGLVAARRGRVFASAGDSVVAEFASAVEAVRCAVEIQQHLEKRNADLSEDRRMRFRIGINLGDVMVEGDNLLGDGVNVAARLQELAEPGGICVSGTVYDQVEAKLSVDFDGLGALAVKNIARPVRVYRVVMEPEAAGKVIAGPKAKAKPWTWPAVAAGVAVIVILAGVAAWLRPWEPTVEPASVERMAFPLPDKPSIAVLPFDNLSGDPAQEYIADGFTESIITELSRDKALFVIARNSTFVYKGKPVQVKQVAEELGVRYVLEGSVQREGEKVRITSQLIDATTGAHVWAERYDREWKDMLSLQDEIAQTIVATLRGYKGTLQQAEIERSIRKPTENLGAYDYVLRGLVHKERFTRDDNAIAKEMFEKAIELDPNYALAYAWLAWAHVIDIYLGWAETPEKSLATGYETARKSVSLDPALDIARWSLGAAHLAAGDNRRALGEYERALELNPNNADILASTVWPLSALGRPEEGIENAKRAMRLNPRYPDWYLWGLGAGHYVARQYADAIAALNRMTHHNIQSRLYLAASYAQSGQHEQARAEVAKALELDPNASIEAVAPRQGYDDGGDLAHFVKGLRKAGLE